MDFKTLKPQTKIIWDSGFSYEIGHFEREADDIMYNTVLVNLITGSQKGKALRSKESIHLYSDEKLNEMYRKYDYWHKSEEENFVPCSSLN